MEKFSIRTTGAESAGTGRPLFWIAGILLALAGVGVGVWWLRQAGIDWENVFLAMMAWLDTRGLEAALWLVVLQALLVVSLIPGPYFTVAAGFLFGLAGGALVSICGSTLGAVVAYWIARGLPQGEIPAWFKHYPGWRLMEEFIVRGGWTMVLSTRLVPLFPFKLSNYFFGRIRFPFWQFFWGTLIGIGPITMISVSVGALASDATTLLGAENPSRGRWTWTLAALLLAAAVFFYASRRAMAGIEKPAPKDSRRVE